MGIFSNIVGSIFNHKLTAAPSDYRRPYIPGPDAELEAPEAAPTHATSPATAGAPTSRSGVAPSTTAAPTIASPASPAVAASSSAPATDGGAVRTEPVDVSAVLTDLASKHPEKLDWRRSIVDLMKLLNLDSSLAARKELADELGYTGDKGDSATMNMWLHKQVLRKLSEHGGKVPEELLV